MKILIISVICAIGALARADGPDYPQAKQIPVIETRFGEALYDQYKWMENASDPDLWTWIEEQQRLTDKVLNEEFRAYFYDALKKPDSSDSEAGKKLAGQLPLDPLLRGAFDSGGSNDESEEYELKIESVYGGDLKRVKIINKEDKSLADILLVKFYSFIKWDSENSFVYKTGSDDDIGESKSAILRHTVGENQANDEVLYQASAAEMSFTVKEVGERHFLIATDSKDNTSRLSLLDLEKKSSDMELPLGGKLLESQEGGVFFYRSFEGANYGEVIRLDFFSGKREVFIPEQDFVAENLTFLEDGIYLVEGHRDAESVAAIYDSSSKELKELSFPSGRIRMAGHDEGESVKFAFNSYSQDTTTYKYDLKESKLSTESQAKDIGIDSKKIHYTAPNGQKAAIWLVTKKGVELSPETPLILYGYGGFHVTLLPYFNSLDSRPWLEKGGAMAFVTLPGSLAYGKEWNEIAKVGDRTVAWDAFAMAGRELIKRGFTSPSRMGIAGGSNGGLLVAGTLQRHPDLFKAATPMVGVLDMLNFNLFTAGKYWEWEYGDPFRQEDFNHLKKISPYHNIENGHYPSVMVMTAEFDDRVAPFHSYKYTARLQNKQMGQAPVLLYNKEWGGHSSRSGSDKQRIGYVAAMYAFFAQELGLEL